MQSGSLAPALIALAGEALVFALKAAMPRVHCWFNKCKHLSGLNRFWDETNGFQLGLAATLALMANFVARTMRDQPLPDAVIATSLYLTLPMALLGLFLCGMPRVQSEDANGLVARKKTLASIVGHIVYFFGVDSLATIPAWES